MNIADFASPGLSFLRHMTNKRSEAFLSISYINLVSRLMFSNMLDNYPCRPAILARFPL